MTDSPTILQQIRRTHAAPTAPGAANEAEPDEAVCPAFGYLRGTRDRALHVVFHRAGAGDSVSLPYTWLGPTRFHPSVGVRLLFVGGEFVLVTIRGRNLAAVTAPGIDLFERGLLRHRVTWVREMPSEEARGLASDACVVDRIEVRVVRPEEAAELFKT